MIYFNCVWSVSAWASLSVTSLIHQQGSDYHSHNSI